MSRNDDLMDRYWTAKCDCFPLRILNAKFDLYQFINLKQKFIKILNCNFTHKNFLIY